MESNSEKSQKSESHIADMRVLEVRAYANSLVFAPLKDIRHVDASTL